MSSLSGPFYKANYVFDVTYFEAYQIGNPKTFVHKPSDAADVNNLSDKLCSEFRRI